RCFPARPRTPVPETSYGLPSSSSSRIDAPPSTASYAMRPSAPAPVWRSHNSRARASSATPVTSRFSTYRKSLPYAWALVKVNVFLFPAERQQMPAESANERSRQRVERADEQPVVDRALPAAVQPPFH